MEAIAVLQRLVQVIDSHDWDGLPSLLHPDFRGLYVHTGEEFDAGGWVRMNAEYPGFEHMTLEESLGSGDRAVGRCHVTGVGPQGTEHFEVATFITVTDGLVRELTEVWADVIASPPPDRRVG